MFCRKCGTEMFNGERFCPRCGTDNSVAAAQPPRSVLNSGVERVYGYAGSTAVEIHVADNICLERNDEPPKKKKKKAKIIIPVIAIVLVVSILAGFLVYISRPEVKIMNAIDKTLFNSSEINCSLSMTDFESTTENGNFNLQIGKGINGIRFEGSFGDSVLLLENGVFYSNGEKSESIDELIDSIGMAEGEYAQEVNDLIDRLDKSIDGKLDKKELTAIVSDFIDLYNRYSEENGGNAISGIESDVVEKSGRSLLKKLKKDDIVILEKEKVSSGTKYTYQIDMLKLLEALADYLDEDKELADAIDSAFASVEGSGVSVSDIQEMLREIAEVVKEFDVETEIDVSFVIDSGRITGIELIYKEDGEKKLGIILEITSKE